MNRFDWTYFAIVTVALVLLALLLVAVFLLAGGSR